MLFEILRRIQYWTLNGGRAELEEEMRLHVALRAAKLQARGVEGAEAETMARRSFGNQLSLHERTVRCGSAHGSTIWYAMFGLACEDSVIIRDLR